MKIGTIITRTCYPRPSRRPQLWLVGDSRGTLDRARIIWPSGLVTYTAPDLFGLRKMRPTVGDQPTHYMKLTRGCTTAPTMGLAIRKALECTPSMRIVFGGYL